MSVLDLGHSRSGPLSFSSMFGLQSVLGLSQKTDPRQDSSGSLGRGSDDSKAPELTSRSSSTLGFLSRSSKRLPAEPSLSLSCEVAIRPSFCWNSHMDTWQAGGVWSQFDSGLKSCQDDVVACTNFLGHQDAAFAGVFDGHGFNGRSAATYACKNITKWLLVDTNAASKDPRRRLKALESVCGQIDRGLARQELCRFDASSSGLTACFGIVQGNRICLATLGNCKAVLGQANSASRQVKAIDLTLPEGTQPRAHSETSSAKALGHRVRAMQSVPTATPFANVGLPAVKQPESFLGRGQLGERPSALPSMTMHQLGDQAQFVILASSGLWEVMTPQEAVDFVHQCRQCRPDTLSCTQALTLEAHTRWKLKFTKVIAEDVGAVIIHCGQVPPPGQPAHRLPAFPEAAATNHDANEEHILHETREFWGRLQPQSLVPLLHTASSKGKGQMPSSLLHVQHPSPSQPLHPQSTSFNPELSNTSCQSGPRDSDASARDGSLASNGQAAPRDQEDSSNHSSKGTTGGSRSVHFDLPSSSSSSGDCDSTQEGGRSQRGRDMTARQSSAGPSRKKSPPMDILFRPETPDASSDYPCNIVSSSGHSTTSVLSAQSSEGGTAKAPSPPNLSQGLHKPSTNPTPFQAAAMTPARSSDLSSDGDSEVSYPLTQPARALSNSPARAHALQPLEEDGASAVTPSIAQLTMMERTHSAPGGIPFGMLVDVPGIPRPRRRLPVSIPEDRPVAPMGLTDADDAEAEAVHRPIRKIYPHGSGDLDNLEAEAGDPDAWEAEVAHTEPQALSRSLGRTKSLDPRSYMPRGDSEGRVHHKAYPSSAQLLSKADLQRVKFPRHNAPVTSAPVWCVETMEGQIRGGLPKVSSHPEGLSDLAGMQAAAEPMASPFARHAARQDSLNPSPPSPLHLTDATSSSTTGSVDPWAPSAPNSGNVPVIPKRVGQTTHGRRSRNNSAAFEELARLRSGMRT